MSALCHPDRRTLAKGLCASCYQKQWALSNVERRRAITRRYREKHKQELSAERKARYAQNRKREIEGAKTWNRSHPEQRQAAQKKWQRTHIERQHTLNRRWYRKHATKHNAAVRARRHSTPGYARTYVATRRAKKKAAFITKVDWHEIYERDQHRCGICQRKVPLKEVSLDHIIPLSKGGTHEPLNVQLAHITCNRQRQNRGPAQLRLKL